MKNRKRESGLILGLIVLIILLTKGSHPASVANQPFSGENALRQAAYLATQIGPRPAGSKEELQAGDYIAATLREYGWQVKTQNFSKATILDRGSLKKYSLINSRNIIAVLPGKSKRSIVIGAHYDSADFNVSGANDNASGVGVLLELARTLGQKPREDTYVIVAFGAEEAGLVGSRYFVENFDLSQVTRMVNLDMVGEGNRVALDGGGKVSTPPQLLQAAFQLARGQGLVPEVKRDFLLLSRDSKEGGTSDFSPFLDKGIPAIGLGQGGKTPVYYHQPSDTVEHLNRETLTKVGRLALALLDWDGVMPENSWSDLYLTFNLHFTLLTVGEPWIQIFVILSVLLALFSLIIKRRKEWLSLVWLVPSLVLVNFTAILISFGPELLLRQLKGSTEPWFGHPVIYVLLHILTVAWILPLFGYLCKGLPPKLLPRQRDVYWAGSVILLGAGTVLMAANRWDFAVYLAFWLILAVLSARRFGIVFALLAPLPIYGLHWQLINSHIWTEFYRSLHAYYPIFAAVYALGITPLVLSLAGCLHNRGSRHGKQVITGICTAWLLCMVAAVILPAYTAQNPQTVMIRQTWQEQKLFVQASSPDILPASLTRALGMQQGAKEGKKEMPAGSQPFNVKIEANAVKLKDERLITIDVQLPPTVNPYLIKLKLRSEEPFTLINGGEFFPLGKLGNTVKLAGEPTGGIYGLVLDRTPPLPAHWQLYLKAKGTVHFSLESQFQDQFFAQQFAIPRTVIKYENWCSVAKDI